MNDVARTIIQKVGNVTSGPADEVVVHRRIGEWLESVGALDDTDITRVLTFQSRHGVPFGQSAVKLGLVTQKDVDWALSQQLTPGDPRPASRDRLAPDLVMALAPQSAQVEAFRSLRAYVAHALATIENEPRAALAVVSASSGDGKSFIAANLAIAFSQLRVRTLLVDADLRRPRLHDLFGIDPSAIGLAEFLAGSAGGAGIGGIPATRRLVHPIGTLRNLYVLPAGQVPDNPSELLQSPAFGRALNKMRAQFDMVIVDTPAAIFGSDALVSATKCGAALMVVRRNHTGMGALEVLASQLEGSRCKLIGPMVNG